MEKEQSAEWHIYNMAEATELPLYHYTFQEDVANLLQYFIVDFVPSVEVKYCMEAANIKIFQTLDA